MKNNTDIKKLLGRRIKELRKQKKLTQEQFAEKVGVYTRNISKIECGTSFVTSQTLSKIISVLEIEPMELFNFKQYDDEENLKKELIEAIQSGKVNIGLLYRFYLTIKNYN